MIIAPRRRSAASKHNGGEGHPEYINYKGVVNLGTDRCGCMYVGKSFGGVALLVH